MITPFFIFLINYLIYLFTLNPGCCFLPSPPITSLSLHSPPPSLRGWKSPFGYPFNLDIMSLQHWLHRLSLRTDKVPQPGEQIPHRHGTVLGTTSSPVVGIHKKMELYMCSRGACALRLVAQLLRDPKVS